MNAKKILGAIPIPVYLAVGALAVLYVIGKKNGGQGVADSIGVGVGKFAGDAAAGAVKGVATGAGRAAAAVVMAPSNAVNSMGAALAGVDDGSWSLGSWLYDVTHSAYDPNSGLQSTGDVRAIGAANTDSIWGRIGGVQLVN